MHLILIAIGYTIKNFVINKENNDKIKIKDINYSPIQLISQLKGYFNVNPVLAISFSLTLFSFAGIPPLVGFFGKQMIFTAALNNNLFFIVFIAILSSVISAVYYLVIIKVMCFDSEHHNINKNVITDNYNISAFYSFNISLISLMIILFIFFDQDLIRLFNIILI